VAPEGKLFTENGCTLVAQTAAGPEIVFVGGDDTVTVKDKVKGVEPEHVDEQLLK
jgi:hypothetical protein